LTTVCIIKNHSTAANHNSSNCTKNYVNNWWKHIFGSSYFSSVWNASTFESLFKKKKKNLSEKHLNNEKIWNALIIKKLLLFTIKLCIKKVIQTII